MSQAATASKPAQQSSKPAPSSKPPEPKKDRKKPEFVPHLKPFMPTILKTIIKPEIDKVILKAGGNIASNADLLKKFRESTGSTVNAKVFGEWLAACGYTVKRAVTLQGFTAPAQQGTPSAT
jgi:hypothetical protein